MLTSRGQHILGNLLNSEVISLPGLCFHHFSRKTNIILSLLPVIADNLFLQLKAEGVQQPLNPD